MSIMQGVYNCYQRRQKGKTQEKEEIGSEKIENYYVTNSAV